MIVHSFVPLPALKKLTAERAAARWQELSAALDALEDLHALMARALADTPPVNLADGGVIRDGYHAELDELRALSLNGKQTIAQMETRERAAKASTNFSELCVPICGGKKSSVFPWPLSANSTCVPRISTECSR